MDDAANGPFQAPDASAFDRWVKAFFVLWSLGALAAAIRMWTRYSPDEWLPVLIPSALALGILIAPVSSRVRIAAALILGIVVRVGGAHSVSAFPLAQYDDPSEYDILSSNLLAGRGLVVWDIDYGLLQALYPPLYPIFLAGAKLMGIGWVAANLLCQAAASLMIWRLAGDRAAAAYFLFPSVVVAALIPSKEPLATALLLGCMLLWKRNSFAYGAISGLLALTQPAWLPVPVVAFFLKRRQAADVLQAAGAGLIVLLPWWVRNYLLFHRFIPLTTSIGFTLGVVFTGHYGPYAQLPYDEPGRSSYALTHTLSAIAHDPLKYLGNVIRQAIRALLKDTAPYEMDTRISWLGTAAIVGQLAWAAAIGTCARAIPKDRRLRSFVAGFLATSFLIGGMWFEFGSRHRAFAVPLLLMWSGLATSTAKCLSAQETTARKASDHPNDCFGWKAAISASHFSLVNRAWMSSKVSLIGS